MSFHDGVAWRIAVILAACLALGAGEDEEDGPVLSAVGDLRVGQWVRVKGALTGGTSFDASEVEVLQPEEDEQFVATIRELLPRDRGFMIGDLPMRTSARTEWQGITPDALVGRQVKVEGHYRGQLNFAVREVSPRQSVGRDRIEGRVEAAGRVSGGWRIRIMIFEIFVPDGVDVESELPLTEYDLTVERGRGVLFDRQNEEEEIPGTVRLGKGLTFGGKFEWKLDDEDNFDLDDDKRSDESKQRLSFRGQLLWEPSDSWYALTSVRHEYKVDREQGEETTRDVDSTLVEGLVYLRNPFGGNVDVIAGRQRFEDRREWLYDAKLDALRAVWTRPSMRLEVSASTVLADGGRRNKETDNYIIYLSNNDQRSGLAAYVVDRRRTGSVRDKPIHFGVRALGEWFPENDVWFELSAVRGYNEDADYSGWGFDVGTTWSPSSVDPVYLTGGVAWGSGDSDPDDDTDRAFRQTGLQDNNGKFGGVTSFKYYGELLEPELSNMVILTAGVGARVLPRTSVDLVFHNYSQVEASTQLLDTNLSAKPNGMDKDLGWGLDLIVGSREWEDWDLELVLATFEPGGAFTKSDSAWKAQAQLRYRF